jgi:23S rRNA (uracil1939-C5)-methyltransferase
MTGMAEQTYLIERLGSRGDGIAEGPVYAPLTLPGETVSGNLNGSELTNIKVIDPSSSRVSPVCRHFKSCGGCQLQHGSNEFVEGWKREIVERALNAYGLNPDIRPVFTSEPQSRRRATLSAKRTKKGAMAGFHARASGMIIEIPDCKLLHPDLMAALPVAEALARIGASRRGELNVSATLTEAGLDIAVEGGVPADGPLMNTLAQEARRFDLARLAWNGEILATQRPPACTFGNATVVPPAGAFLQATQSGEAALLSAVTEITQGASRIVDLFAGCGTFALPLTELAEVHAVEASHDMMQALDDGWRKAAGLKPLTIEIRDLFRRPLLPDELARFDACVIDPPRAGADAQIAELARAGIAKIAHLSCNPITFSRDTNILVQAGYTIDWVQIIDQFRWSSHIELAASFTLTSA